MITRASGAAGLVALGAVLLAASYPPFHLPLLSFVALVPAVVLLRQFERTADLRAALRWGFWYGFVTQGAVLYWLVVALWHFTPLSALGYLATITIFGMWNALLFWFVVRLRTRLPAVSLALVFPMAWTAVEWAVGHQGDIRFPWLGLGTSLATAPVLVQWADLAGARGATLWLAWCNVLLVEAFARGGAVPQVPEGGRGAAWRWAGGWGWGRGSAGRLACVVTTLLAAAAYGTWKMHTLPMREVGTVGLVQPNEGFREKWDPAHADSVVAKLVDMSHRLEAQGTRLDLLIWPEAAVPGYLEGEPRWDAELATLARTSQTPILTGSLYAPLERADQYYNAAYFYDSTGMWRHAPVYGKHYLVPVVERVPFVPVALFRRLPGLRNWAGGFSRGRALPLYHTAIGRFGVLICYESAFEDLGRRYRHQGADFLVNITNDAWYGRTAGPYQHASHLVLRAIESRVGIARAANDGISEFVDPLGRTYAATHLEEEAGVVDRLRTSDVIPLYVLLGDWVGLLVVLGTLGLAGTLVFVERRAL